MGNLIIKRLSQIQKDRFLYQSVYNENYKLAKKLLKYGADVNTNISAYGESIIQRAIMNEDVNMIMLLLSYHIIITHDDLEFLRMLAGKKKLEEHQKSLKVIKHKIDIKYNIPPGMDNYLNTFIMYNTSYLP